MGVANSCQYGMLYMNTGLAIGFFSALLWHNTMFSMCWWSLW